MPKILLIGDLILDRYVHGACTHIAPDAPVPVFVQDHVTWSAGGAWNVARNILKTGVPMTVISVAGEDGAADAHNYFTPDEAITIKFPERTTHIKTRFIGQYGRQVLRFDNPKDGALTGNQFQHLISAAATELKKGISLIVLADYGNGVVSGDLIRWLLNNTKGIPILVDPYPTQNPLIYSDVHFLKLNGRERRTFEERMQRPLSTLGATIIETNGEEPIKVLGRQTSEVFEVEPPRVQALVDPCGAGDVFLAYFAASMARGSPLKASVELAARAAAISVTKAGTCVVEASEVNRSRKAKSLP